MTRPEPTGGATDARPASPLTEIEALTSRVRAGELNEEAALSRIAVVVRDLDRLETYQKPLG